MAVTTATGATTQPVDVGLRREMGLIGATWASETSIIGSGWLFGAFYASVAAGPAALIGWIIGGVAVTILALAHAELGAMFPVAGGTARFPHFAFGSTAGTSFGFFSWLQAITTAPIECYACFQYLAYYDHGLYNPSTQVVTQAGFFLTIALIAIFTAVNFLAMKYFNLVNAGFTWWKIAIPVLAIIILFTKFHAGNFTSQGFNPFGMKALFAAIPSAGIVFAYTGFEQADQLAAEIKNPQRNLPRAIIYAMMIGTLIYLLLQVVFTGAMPHSLFAHGWAGLNNQSVISDGPFAGLAGLVGFSWLAILLRIDAVISPSATGMIYLTATSRVGYGLGRNRYYPQFFTWVDRRGIPWLSLILAFVLGLFFLLPFPSWHSLVSLVTDAALVMYGGAPLSLAAFRKRLPDFDRKYRMTWAPVLCPIAFIIANLMIYWSGLEVVWKLGVAILIGYALIGISMYFDKQRPPMEWRSAAWLPAWLIGLGILSWQGQYSGGAVAPPVNTNNLPFGWDMLVVAAFSLAIYYWAVAVAAPREDILSLIGQQSEMAPDPNMPGA